MVWVTEKRSNMPVQSLVEQIIADECLSRYEYLHLTSTILADYQLSDEDRRQIGRLLDYVQIGRIRLVD
ncbi:MAG: hypothetical protein KME07_19055 [Pegethrix bostrychoides GSE-TBD4-15B]|uniref:Uncharacterized protein n=1 Tax=Pegethrix bostrychoides GSE-TBD4-15B TaxID=2839662 RepID=A0A951PE68_9CYAN|nr:hypothetical protein [Pegethrix bostrychoides GSE-TBD4-15B]